MLASSAYTQAKRDRHRDRRWRGVHRHRSHWVRRPGRADRDRCRARRPRRWKQLLRVALGDVEPAAAEDIRQRGLRCRPITPSSPGTFITRGARNSGVVGHAHFLRRRRGRRPCDGVLPGTGPVAQAPSMAAGTERTLRMRSRFLSGAMHQVGCADRQYRGELLRKAICGTPTTTRRAKSRSGAIDVARSPAASR